MDTYHTEVTRIWLDYYHELTGKDGVPSRDESGNLYWWIAKFAPKFQTDILDAMYEAGFNAGARQTAQIMKIIDGAAQNW